MIAQEMGFATKGCVIASVDSVETIAFAWTPVPTTAQIMGYVSLVLAKRAVAFVQLAGVG